ncbi:hypothetical protein WHR41_01544 [Cladosporium halotolerans]|uniref:Uncharacterized protein n=1 Tax=Cladosporium halotolerans TaxID=1052096 RepID=A0AB34KWX5_9PEZI
MAQVVTIVNKSGKIVKSGKTLAGVFNDAKSAYSERKAELKLSREREKEAKEQERKARSQLEALTLADETRSRGGSRAGSETRSKATTRKPVPSRRDRPNTERGYSDSVISGEDAPRRAGTNYRPSPLRFDNSGEPMYDDENEPKSGQLMRRHTGHIAPQTRSQAPPRRASYNDIDMDLAYGDMPPPLAVTKVEDNRELQEKMSGLQKLLDEFNCLQHSAGATIENLQKNPEALAAVGLTLAEISTMVTKLAPGALPALKSSFPAIMALLASPQFAIAAGVTVGVTVIAFGGYKIIKKIQESKKEKSMLEPGFRADNQIEPASPAESVDELRELSSIERWRRGIADEQAQSVGTSVDGEFITPVASRTLIEEGKLTEADFKPKEKQRKSKSRKAQSESGRSVRSEKSSRSGSSRAKGEKKKREKEPSGLKMLFSGHSVAR